jgi:hypothetical protein
MAGLVPAIHVLCTTRKDVDARDKPGHDAEVTGMPLPIRLNAIMRANDH